MPSKEHVHKYIRAIGRITKYNKDSGMLSYYKCAFPDCTHYTKAELVLGKMSICNRCDKLFTLPLALSLLTNRPICKECIKKKKVARILENVNAGE